MVGLAIRPNDVRKACDACEAGRRGRKMPRFRPIPSVFGVKILGDLRLSSLLADFSAAAEAQVCALCQRLGASLVPGGHGAARLRLAFARAWQLQEATIRV